MSTPSTCKKRNASGQCVSAQAHPAGSRAPASREKQAAASPAAGRCGAPALPRRIRWRRTRARIRRSRPPRGLQLPTRSFREHPSPSLQAQSGIRDTRSPAQQFMTSSRIIHQAAELLAKVIFGQPGWSDPAHHAQPPVLLCAQQCLPAPASAWACPHLPTHAF